MIESEKLMQEQSNSLSQNVHYSNMDESKDLSLFC